MHDIDTERAKQSELLAAVTAAGADEAELQATITEWAERHGGSCPAFPLTRNQACAVLQLCLCCLERIVSEGRVTTPDVDGEVFTAVAIAELVAAASQG